MIRKTFTHISQFGSTALILFTVSLLLISGTLAFAASSMVTSTVTSPSGQVQTVTLKLTPGKVGKKLKLYTQVKLAKPDGSKAVPATHTDVLLPKGFQTNYKKFPTCNPYERFEGDANTTSCLSLTSSTSGAQVGSGTAIGDASPITIANAKVWVFNGCKSTETTLPSDPSTKVTHCPTSQPGGKLVFYAIPDIGPNITLVGSLSKMSGKYSYKLSIHIDPIQVIPGAANATISEFHVTIGKTRKGLPFIANPSKCKKTWPYQFDFKYENGESVSVPLNVPCKK